MFTLSENVTRQRAAALQKSVITNKLRSTEDALSHNEWKHKRVCTRGKGERHERLPVSAGSSQTLYRKAGLLERTGRNVRVKNERAESVEIT